MTPWALIVATSLAAAPPLLSGASKDFELVVKAAPRGDTLGLTAFLSDFETNTPVRKAEVAIEIVGPIPQRLALEEHEPGIYEGAAKTPPAALVSVIARVRTSGSEELFTAENVLWDRPTPSAGPPATQRTWPWIVATALTLSLLAFGVIWALRRRARLLALVLCVGAGQQPALAHEGESHDAPTPPPGAESTAPPHPQGDGIYFPKESQFLLGIRTEQVAMRDLQPRLRVLGTVVARADGHAELRAPQTGRVVAIGDTVPVLGDRVKQGQPLVAIEQSLGATERGELRTRAVGAETGLRAAQARLSQAEDELARLRALQGIASDREVKAAEVAVRVAREEVAKARAESNLYRNTPGGLGRVVVTSPLDGVVIDATVSAGGQVNAGDLLVEVGELSRLWVRAEIYEPDLPEVSRGSGALLTVEGYPDERFEAKLFRRAQSVNVTTRTATALFEVANPEGKLMPGMMAELAVALGQPVRTLTVSDAAIVEQEGRRFVFVHTQPEMFLRREVRLGRRDGTLYEVLDGLAVGDRVVTQGAYHVRSASR